MATFLLACSGILLLRLGRADITLFNGAQDIMFEDAPSECLAAFDNSLNCDYKVQVLAQDMDHLEFTGTDLSRLCTPSCKSDLTALETAVSSACGDYDIDFNGAYISAVQVVDLFLYKYDMSCLADSTGGYCLTVEATWNVNFLNESGQATWPTYTDKRYPYFDDNNYDGSPAEDGDGNLLDLSEPPITWPEWAADMELEASGQDYYTSPLASDWQGHGYDGTLEYDEYPLEIQCSECFLLQYKLGIESQWGEVYDEVSDQVWHNIKQNCDLDWTIVPANNQSTWTTTYQALEWNNKTVCDQVLQYQSDNPITPDAFALLNNVPTAALVHLNPTRQDVLSPGDYCAPLPCTVAVIDSSESMSANNFVDSLDNITLTQFWSWNNYMDSKSLQPGEIVCIGAPGGAYTPVTVPEAVPSVYSTTATPPAPTKSGTARSCGKYYEVKAGDGCADVSLANSITLSEFLALNTELNSQCSNLLAGYAYCVASVNGTTTDSSPTASSVATPSPIQDGMTKNCNRFYQVQSEDGCYDIASRYGISLDDFYEYNPAVGDDCSKLYPDDYVCVGIAESCFVDVTFKTTYSTEWGESVWVVGSWQSWDANNGLMLTGSSGSDGSTNWQGKTQLQAETQFSYKFIKLRADGTPVWEEDPNRDFETPRCADSEVQEGGKWHDGTFESPACTAVKVRFEVKASTAYGEAVYIIGDAPNLGSWDTSAAVALNADSYTEQNPLWTGTVDLALGEDVQYKFIKIGLDGSFTWEADPNRQLKVPTDCAAVLAQTAIWQ